MDTYIDAEGAFFKAQQLSGPTIVNVGGGEVCANAGDWLAYLPAGGFLVVTDGVFKTSFIKAE